MNNNKINNTGPKKILSEVIAELKRENATRANVYPRWIREGKIIRDDAEHRYLCIATAIKELEMLQAQKVGRQSGFFDTPNPFTPKNILDDENPKT